MGYLLYILTLISFIMGIWRIGYALFYFCNCNIVTWNFDTIPPAGYGNQNLKDTKGEN